MGNARSSAKDYSPAMPVVEAALAELTTEEVLALSSCLVLPDPPFLRATPISDWPEEVRQEVDRIGVRSLLARDLIRQRDDSPVVPEILGELMDTICEPDTVGALLKLRRGKVRAISLFARKGLVALHEATRVGNHRFGQGPRTSLLDYVIEIVELEDRPLAEGTRLEIDADALSKLTDAVRSGADGPEAFLTSAGMGGEQAAELRPLLDDKNSVAAVRLLRRVGDTAVEGTFTTWIDAEEEGLWLVEEMAEGAARAVSVAPASREDIVSSITEGIADAVGAR